MGTQAGVGISHHRNPKQAGYDAANQALQAANITTPDFVLMFASVGYNQRILLDAVRETTQKTPLIGCSGEGVIVQGEADESNFSVAVMVIQSDEIRFSQGGISGLSQDVQAVGAEVGQALSRSYQEDTITTFLFADGMSFNFDRLISALEANCDQATQVPLLGGLAADNYAIERTYQYCDDNILTDGVVWATLAGSVQIAWAINHGCVPLGSKYTVTRAQGNQIFELDDQPVLAILREYLLEEEFDNWELAFRNLCLGLKTTTDFQAYDEFFVRGIIHRDVDAGSITIPTDIQTGTEVWMVRRDEEKIEAGIHHIAQQISDQLGGHTPKL
ncbi:MAG: FIST C-terminal domain-containing protein, partial [Cyanobacteria bacterium]|nr:FIST C-terminal domain-containing protein [Cyanobacteriota bacterium]